ncbi:ribosome-recycling factor, mitochondrial-like isoform X2 [Rhopilema esculentum]|uniref:ribosome-recycling factor, mitochondrial-like isoform X2 n=1 Tax=Rhopilema esculentum TaxID=499914 RepID=UPI0031E01EC9
MALQKSSKIWLQTYANFNVKHGIERVLGLRPWRNCKVNRGQNSSSTFRKILENENFFTRTEDFHFRVLPEIKRLALLSRSPSRDSAFTFTSNHLTLLAKLELVVADKCNKCLRRSISYSAHLYSKKAQKSKSKGKKLSLAMDDAEGIVDLHNLQQRMEEVLEEMNQDLATKVPLRITTGFLDNILIEITKGKKVPLYQVAQIKSTSDFFHVEIQDTFLNASKVISSAIIETGFNMQPTTKGNTITIPIPLFTHDQRNSIEKVAKVIANSAKDGLRKVRQKGMVQIRNNKEGQSKDFIRRIENQVLSINHQAWLFEVSDSSRSPPCSPRNLRCSS